jgi:hypothetical protein
MIRIARIRFAIASVLVAASVGALPCSRGAAQSKETVQTADPAAAMNGIAERFVKLALAVGEHDPLYVDAYFGPKAWRTEAAHEKKPLAASEQEAMPLLAELQALDVSKQGEVVRLRRMFLIKQLGSLVARTRILRGARYTFDEESKSLFDIEAPPFDEGSFKARLARVDSLLPSGEGSLTDRLDRFKKDFMIPKDKVGAVFSAAINEARKRTREHIPLPANESFAVEYVTNKSWGAYNWYKGDNRSVIQINTDLPKYIDSPVSLACHEGYPGHHVQNVLFEQHLVKERGWVEFTVAPLFSPLSPINEGTADFGAEVAFPGDERLAFEREVLYPLAGLDPARAASYSAVMKLVRELASAENEAARRYLSGDITAEDAAQFLYAYALMPLERARKLVTFIDQYRSYVVNYSVGYDLVKAYIEKKGGTADHPVRLWEEYAALISVPRVPSELK